MSFNSSVNIQMEFIISSVDIPKKKSALKERLGRFGVDYTEDDKIFIVDNDGDRIEVDDNNIAYLSKNVKNVKFILVKFEKPERLLLDRFKNNFDMNPSFYNEDFSLTKIPDNFEFCGNELYKLLESFPTNENKHILNNPNTNFNNISFDNFSFTESVILSQQDSCFQMMYKKYVGDLMAILNSSDNNENEIQKFYDYFNDQENDKFFNLIESFTPEEIKHAKEMILPFHNLLINFNEFKNNKINELLRSIKNNYEKLKIFEFNIRDERRKLRNLNEVLETNKGFFNRFMIELQDQVRDLNLNLGNNNFEPNAFDDNLSKLFSFIIQLCYDITQLRGNNIKFKLLKTEKYVKLKHAENDKINKNCPKHNFCREGICPFNIGNNLIQYSTINRFMCENIYKGDKLYDV